MPSPINADFLIVGAGGGGGADNGGNGGGGEVAQGTAHPFAAGTYNVYVGKGDIIIEAIITIHPTELKVQVLNLVVMDIGVICPMLPILW